MSVPDFCKTQTSPNVDRNDTYPHTVPMHKHMSSQLNVRLHHSAVFRMLHTRVFAC